MKRFLLAMLLVFAVGSITACGGSELEASSGPGFLASAARGDEHAINVHEQHAAVDCLVCHEVAPTVQPLVSDNPKHAQCIDCHPDAKPKGSTKICLECHKSRPK
jgi:hypothetical protein